MSPVVRERNSNSITIDDAVAVWDNEAESWPVIGLATAPQANTSYWVVNEFLISSAHTEWRRMKSEQEEGWVKDGAYVDPLSGTKIKYKITNIYRSISIRRIHFINRTGCEWAKWKLKTTAELWNEKRKFFADFTSIFCVQFELFAARK